MTIKNYGLMWERDCVHWSGARGNAGRLMGKGPIGKPNKDQLEVDFRHQIGVYILYRNESVVYVGQAGAGNNTLFSRLKNHFVDHLADRWGLIRLTSQVVCSTAGCPCTECCTS